MSESEDESNKDHARQIALAMVSDLTSGKTESIDDLIRDNPEIAVELKRQLKLLGLVKAVTEQQDTRRHEIDAGPVELGTTRVLGLLDTGGVFHEEPTLVPCPSCRQRLPQIDFATDETSRKVTCLHCDNSVLLLNNRKGLQAGSMIAQFELVSRLGSGSFGLVWKARDTRLKRDVAIKVPRRGLLTSEQQELFLREARVAAAIRHPYVVAIHDTGVDRGTVFICSELIDGKTLSQWHRESCDSPRTAASMMRKIAFAIQAIHDSSVIHRDLKPSNVMVDENGDPQVMDFGLAKQDVFEATMTLSGEILGTPAYMSPEAAKGESRSSDPRTDIYSLGVMLYELLTGELPFHGDFAQLLQQILHRKPPSPIDINPAVHRELETICLKCLEKEPADRYQSALAMADDLGHFEEGRPITARPKSLSKRIVRACQARPALALSVVSLAAVLLLLVSTTQYVFVALRTSASNAKDNKDLRQTQQKELSKKDDELSEKKVEIATVEAALFEKQEESRVRNYLSVLTAETDSAIRLAETDPVKSLRLATKAVMDLEALDSSNGQSAIGIEKSELLAQLQQTLGNGLQQLHPFANEDLGEVVLSVQSGRKNVVGVLSVSRDSDEGHPFFINVVNLKGKSVSGDVGNQKLDFSRCRLSSAVNQLEINATGTAVLGFVRDATDARAAEATRLWRRERGGKTVEIPIAVQRACFPVWSDDVWILDVQGEVSCWGLDSGQSGTEKKKFTLDIPLPVTSLIELSGEGEFVVSFGGRIHAVQIDVVNGGVKQTELAGVSCHLVPLESAIPLKEAVRSTNRICWWDSDQKKLVVETWSAGMIDAGRQQWSVHLPEAEDVQSCFVSERGDWICAAIGTLEDLSWMFCSLHEPSGGMGGILLQGDPANGIQVRQGVHDIAVASGDAVFYYQVENDRPVMKNQFAKRGSRVGAFCWLGDRPEIAVVFDDQIHIRHCGQLKSSVSFSEDSDSGWFRDREVLTVFGDSISEIYSNADGSGLLALDGSGAMDYWQAGDVAEDLYWERKLSPAEITQPRVQISGDGMWVAVLDAGGRFELYPSPKVNVDSLDSKMSPVSVSAVSDFELQGSTLVLAREEANVQLYRFDSQVTKGRELPIQANEALVSVDQKWLCLRQEQKIYMVDLQRPRDEPWEIDGVEESAEMTFVGSGSCLATVGLERTLSVWNPDNRTRKRVELAPLGAEKNAVIGSKHETLFPTDDGRVLLLRHTDDGGCFNAGYVQVGKNGNDLSFTPSRDGKLWAASSVPPWNAKAKFNGASMSVGHFDRVKVAGAHSGNDLAYLSLQGGLPQKLEKPQRASVIDLSDAVMAISPGNQWLVRSSPAGFDAWQLLGNQLLPNSSQAGGSDPATQLVFSSDEDWLVSGHKSGKVRFWKIVGSSLILSTPIEWSIHSSPIESIVVDSRSGWCFCMSSDRISCLPMDIDILMNAAKPAVK